MSFVEFPKMARWNRGAVVTEKIDGTNASVLIAHRVDCAEPESLLIDSWYQDGEPMVMLAGSRTRFITPENDNAGFAGWVKRNAEQLRALGQGHHFGEWWGQGIQRRYGLTEKRFSLFNAGRWSDNPTLPACCHLVPTLWHGMLMDMSISTIVERLRSLGSEAAPGFMQPEGIVIYHTHGGVGFKYTLDKNDGHKGAA